MKYYLAILFTLTIPFLSYADPLTPTSEQVAARSFYFEKPNLEPDVKMQIARYSGASGIDPEIMLAISKCESNWNPKAKSPTADHGLFQINQVHFKEVKRMGLDLYNPIDNILFAIHLFNMEGTRPWNASAKCWRPKIAETPPALALRDI